MIIHILYTNSMNDFHSNHSVRWYSPLRLTNGIHTCHQTHQNLPQDSERFLYIKSPNPSNIHYIDLFYTPQLFDMMMRISILNNLQQKVSFPLPVEKNFCPVLLLKTSHCPYHHHHLLLLLRRIVPIFIAAMTSTKHQQHHYTISQFSFVLILLEVPAIRFPPWDCVINSL